MGGKVELNGWDKVFNGDGISIFTILPFTVHGTFLCLLILAVYLWDCIMISSPVQSFSPYSFILLAVIVKFKLVMLQHNAPLMSMLALPVLLLM